jgi:membrane protein YqaA with SNARE-associated domain
MAPLGPWAVFFIALEDSAAIALPIDALIAAYVYARPTLLWIILFPLLASVGAAIGSLVIYAIGRKGGEVALAKRVSPEKLAHLRQTFEKREFLALLIPAMTPPPMPFKLFAFAAGVFQMRLRDFLAAIFTGRFIRFLLLAILTVKFGPQIVDIAKDLIGRHLGMTLGGIAVLVLVIWLIVRAWREPMEELAHDLEEAES